MCARALCEVRAGEWPFGESAWLGPRLGQRFSTIPFGRRRRPRQSDSDAPCAFVFRRHSTRGGRPPACAAGRIRKIPGAAQSFPGRGEWVGGPWRERRPAGRGNPEPRQPCPLGSRPGRSRCSCGLQQGCTRAGEGPKTGARVSRGPEGWGCPPWGRPAGGGHAIALARQVGGGGEGRFCKAAAYVYAWGPFKRASTRGPGKGASRASRGTLGGSSAGPRDAAGRRGSEGGLSPNGVGALRREPWRWCLPR